MKDKIYREIKKKWDAIAKPLDGLGRLEEIVCRMGAVLGDVTVDISRRALVVMCADNGIVEEGVSQSGQDVTWEVAAWMGVGESSVCHLAKQANVDVFVVDVGINVEGTPEGVIPRKVACGTRDFLVQPAMTEAECRQAIRIGVDMARECKEQGYRVLALGEMGIGNTTTSAALAALLLKKSPEEVCGRGAGLSDEGLRRKIAVVERAVEQYGTEWTDGNGETGWSIIGDPSEAAYAFRTLCAVGGFDIAALAGVCIGAAEMGLPVVLDGFITAAAALVANRMRPGVADVLIASHMGREQGMRPILEELGLSPIIDADLALGEGSGAVLLFPLLDAALALYRNGKRFADSAVEQYERQDG